MHAWALHQNDSRAGSVWEEPTTRRQAGTNWGQVGDGESAPAGGESVPAREREKEKEKENERKRACLHEHGGGVRMAFATALQSWVPDQRSAQNQSRAT